MSTDPETVAFIEDQLAGLRVRTLRMFGEFGIYCDEKIVGLICDDTLFLKPTSADPALFTRTEPAPPYSGAKDYLRVPGDALEDREWLGAAVQATADALPQPKAKTPKSPPKSPTSPTSPKSAKSPKSPPKSPLQAPPKSPPAGPGASKPRPRRPSA